MRSKSIAAWGRFDYFLYFSVPTVILVGLYFATLKHNFGPGLVSVVGPGWVPTRSGTSHYINILTILGSVLAVLGIYMTYRQLKDSFDRIETYDQLFRAIDQIIDEIQNKKAHEFYFSGSTLLPGALASADRGRANALEERLEMLFGKGAGSYELPKELKIRILIPSEKNVNRIFDFYSGKCVQGRKNEVTTEVVQRELERAESLVKTADEKNSKRTNSKVVRLSDDDPNTTLLEGEYFFSNGLRTVHVLLLHYQPAPGGNVVAPALLGTNTRDSTILSSLKQRFYALDRLDKFGDGKNGS